MKYLRLAPAALVALAMGIALSACSPAPAPSTEAASQAAPASAASDGDYAIVATAENYVIRSYRNAEVQAQGDGYTVRRTEERLQGLSIVPLEDPRPALLSFSVTGQVQSVRAYRLGVWTDLPSQRDHSIRFGPGGAYHIMVVPSIGGGAVVTVNGAADCRSLPSDSCPVFEAQTAAQLRP